MRRHAVVPLSAERVVPNWSQAPAALSSRDRLLAKPLAAPFRLHGRYEPCRRCVCCICWSLPTALIIDGAERVWPYERACRPQGNRKRKEHGIVASAFTASLHEAGKRSGGPMRRPAVVSCDSKPEPPRRSLAVLVSLPLAVGMLAAPSVTPAARCRTPRRGRGLVMWSSSGGTQ